jgi:hypothetical protein
VALDQCHDGGICDHTTGVCSNPAKADGSTCNDGNACTRSDSCQAGVCIGANAVACIPLDQCHIAGTCDPTTGACSNPTAAGGTFCNDGNACTQTDTCNSAGVCIGGNFAWSGVLQPINSDGSSIFKLGSTVPVKFDLTGLCAGMSTLNARIFLAKITDGILGSEMEAVSTAASDSGNTFRYDAASGQYIFNLSTKAISSGTAQPLSAGTWQILIKQYQGDTPVAVIGTVNISLKR